jgi:HD-GYP domain-containing protein (c-di-GMP phosphodiesterase class II)
MRVAKLQDTLEGTELALPIHSDDGRLLLTAGAKLNRRIIRLLQSHGYTRVAINDTMSLDIELDDAITFETRLQAEKALGQTVDALVKGQTPNLSEVIDVVDTIIFELREKSQISSGLYSIHSFDANTFTHSINVCVLSLAIAAALNWPLSKMRELGAGAILHDIGKILMPLPVLNKPGKLTNEEYELIKTHAHKGWELLINCFGVGACASQSALEHHERLDGSGYPRNLTGSEISDIGKITAVADVYEAMTADRPHRKAMFPELVYAHMSEGKNTMFDGDLVDTLFSKVALFPNGTILSLEGNYICVVTEQDLRSSFRPYVRILDGPDILKPLEVALFERPDLKIEIILDDYPEEVKKRVSDAFGGKAVDLG